MKKITIGLLAFGLITSSCDCGQHIEGIVIDQDTQQPIDSVIIIRNKMDQYIYTDSLGKFNITGVTVGGWFGYPGMSVSFIKNGYKKVTKRYKNWNDVPITIILEKSIE